MRDCAIFIPNIALLNQYNQNKQARNQTNVWTIPSSMHTREIAHIRGFTLIIAFPRKSTVNGGHGGITCKIISVLEASLVRPSRQVLHSFDRICDL